MNYRDVLSLDISNSDDLGKARRAIAVEKLARLVHADRAGSPVPNPDGPAPVGTSWYRVGYETGTGNRMSLLVDVIPMQRKDISLLTEYEQVKFCGNCKGSSGGCPGFAPRFEWLKKGVDRFVVVTVSIDMIWAIMYATPQDGWAGGRILKQLVYADRLTECYCIRMLRHLQDYGYVLGAGNCVGCHPKHCTVIKGQPCKTPKRRTFSMEAVGVDCDAVHEMIYEECLPWYYKGTNKIPSYITRYIGLFPNADIVNIESVVADFVMGDKSYISVSDVPRPRDATISLQCVPHGAHKGDFQYVYNDPGLKEQV